MTDRSQSASMQAHIEGLMASPRQDSFLIVTVKGTEEFIQFTSDQTGVQLDFPIITARQRTKEQSFRETAKKQGLAVIESKGSDGSRFLDINIEGSPSEVSQVARAFVADFLDVTDDSDLEYKAEY